MKILRLILNNGFLIILLVVAAVLSLAYSTRDQDQPIQDPKAHISNTEKTNKQIESNNVPSLLVEKTDDKKPVGASLNEMGSNSADQPKANQTVIEVEQPEDDNIPEQDSAPQILTETESQSTENDDADSADKPLLQATEAEQQTVSTSPNASTTPISNRELITSTLSQYESFEQAWQAARSAFSNQDLQQAERLYDALAMVSQHPDVLGEYGNLMWDLKQPENASKLWIASAEKWITSNQVQRAAYLAQRLKPYAPDATAQIWKAINSHQANPGHAGN